MQDYTTARDTASPDQIWITEHPPIYTQGLNGKPEHLLRAGDIPVINSDRGGQITYHGPGQVVIYVLIDLKRRRQGPRWLVSALENAAIGVLAQYGVPAQARPEAPGVYVDGRKIGALGLRIRGGCSYHGLSLNNDMDLEPFNAINPCGYPGLAVTQLADQGVRIANHELASALVHQLIQALSS